MKKRVLSLALALLLAISLLPALPASAADEEADFGYLNVSLGDAELIKSGTVMPENFPQGVSFDAENAVLTLDHFVDASAALDIYSFEEGQTLTLNLVGENTMKEIYVSPPTNLFESGELRLTGSGTLNVACVFCNRFVMESGTLNVTQTAAFFENNYREWYAFYGNYGQLPDDDHANYYRFLGGEVNIDCTDDLGDGRVGMDVQSGNIEIRNAKVRIDLGDNEWLALGIGWSSQGQTNGGTLTMENGSLEIIGAKYQIYFYELKNEGDPLHYYVGKDGPERELTFKECFEQDDWFYDRYDRQTKGKGYLLLTNETVDVPEPQNPFVDVQPDAYYYDPVIWAVNHDPLITNGTSPDTFSPDMTCTRAQVVTFLWRAAGSPKPYYSENPFTDVSPDAYYYNAVLWAVQQDITQGTGDGLFSPDGECTRGQVVTFLHRANDEPDVENAENPFHDVAADAYYYNAVLWAVENGITSGTGAGAFSPDVTCSRGQIVTFLYRAMR